MMACAWGCCAFGISVSEGQLRDVHVESNLQARVYRTALVDEAAEG